jgi:hypothetical protein
VILEKRQFHWKTDLCTVAQLSFTFGFRLCAEPKPAERGEEIWVDENAPAE